MAMSDNSCCTEMVKSVTASFQKQHLNESGMSDNSYTEMENPKEGSGSGSDNLSTEMDNPIDEVDEIESGSDIFYAKVVRFKKEYVCNEDEDLRVVWDKKVKGVLARYGVECELKWDEEMMSLTGTRLASPNLIYKAWMALYVIASGVGTRIVEPIMSGKLHCSVVKLISEAGVRTYDSEEKYEAFVRQFEEHKLPDLLSCCCLYQDKAIVILSWKEGSIIAVSELLGHCLFGDVPFEEAVKGVLRLLRDVESTT